MSTDVKSVRATVTGTAVAFPVRIKGAQLLGGASAGTVQLRDGGAGGELLMELDVGIGASVNVRIPENGVRFMTDVHITVTNVAAATLFYA